MAITIDGTAGTITGVSTGGLPDGIVDADMLATGAVTSANIADGTITTDDISSTDVKSLKSGRKNLIINGGFDVWQRGTSGTGGSIFVADRWYNSSQSATMARQTFTVGQTDVSGFPKYYIRLTAGSTEWYGQRQKVEDVTVLGGQEVTLSYWMKGSSSFSNQPFRSQQFGSGGSADVSSQIGTDSVTTSWQKFTHTFTLPSITGKTVGTSSFTEFSVLRANITSITVDLANVQLELGDTATDFEHRSYGEELALCQRYYERIGIGSPGLANSSTGFWTGVTYKVPKRIDGHSITLLSSTVRYYKFGITNRDTTSGYISGFYENRNGIIVKVEGFSGLTVNESVILGGPNTGVEDDVFAAEAEL